MLLCFRFNFGFNFKNSKWIKFVEWTRKWTKLKWMKPNKIKWNNKRVLLLIQTQFYSISEPRFFLESKFYLDKACSRNRLYVKMSENYFKILEVGKMSDYLTNVKKSENEPKKSWIINPQTRSYLEKSRKTEVHCRTCSFANMFICEQDLH